MRPEPSLLLNVHEPLLVNLAGHTIGALLFAIFGVMLLRERGSRLSLAAAGLALIWHVGSLIVLGVPSQGSVTAEVVVSLSSSALSLLPAVLLHIALERGLSWAIATGYAISGVSAALHFVELFVHAPPLHRTALLLTAFGVGFVALAVALAILRRGGRPGRLAVVIALVIFSLSFVHFQRGGAHDAWALELMVHHASIPVAFLILLQDYRFLLVDAFLRVTANILLAAAFAFVAMRLALISGIGNFWPRDPREQTLWMLAFCVILIGFALLRTLLQRVLTHLVFRQADVERAVREVREGEKEHPSFESYLQWSAERMAAYVRGELLGAPATDGQSGAVFPYLCERQTGAVIVPLRISPAETYHVTLGRRAGGRRYLSEDLQALARLASEIVEHLKHIREAELRDLVTRAELKALQSQIHPHFLFNALNTLYGIIPREAQGARQTVLNLADIFRYFLRTERPLVPLEEELAIVRAYLDIESLRLGPKLKVEMEVAPEAKGITVPVLLIQPLVENAVKHGVASREQGGKVAVSARIENQDLVVTVSDTGPGFGATQTASDREAVGLENVRRRLRLHFGDDAALRIDTSAGATTVSVCIPVAVAAASP